MIGKPTMAFFTSTLKRARDWGECALELAFPWPARDLEAAVRIEPPFCRQCGMPFPTLEPEEEAFMCAGCAERRWDFQWARAGYRAEGEVLDAIVGFKYRDEYYEGRRLTDWLTEAFDKHAGAEAWDALVPVPLFPRHRRERGFNQAAELARGLGRKRKLPVWDCLYRCRETPSQTGLRRTARWENMAGAFRAKPKFDAQGRNLLLIDDVFTTGATTNACAQVLAEAGAARLAVLTVARS
jgi:ComF family protein